MAAVLTKKVRRIKVAGADLGHFRGVVKHFKRLRQNSKVRQMLVEGERVAADMLDRWRSFCVAWAQRLTPLIGCIAEPLAESELPDGFTERLKTEREVCGRSAEAALRFLRLAERVNGKLAAADGLPAVDPKAIKRHLKRFEMMAADVKEMTSADGLLAVAVRWPRVSDAARKVSSGFIPTQAMCDESWG